MIWFTGESPSPLVPLPASEPLPVGESLLTHDSPLTSESPATSESHSGSDGQEHPKPNSQIVNVEQALKDAGKKLSDPGRIPILEIVKILIYRSHDPP